MIGRLGARRLVAGGALLVGAGAAIVMVGLLDVPLFVPYVGWAIGSVGMGIVWPTIPLSVMSVAQEGREAGELSPDDPDGLPGRRDRRRPRGGERRARGPRAGTISIEAGLAGAFGVGIVAAMLLVLVARRLPDARRGS